MAKLRFSILMVSSMRVILEVMKDEVKGFIIIQMEITMKENG